MLGRKVAMHVAAANPLALSQDDIDASTVERERAVLIEQAKEAGKPENIIEKMVEGRLRNFFAERALCEQPFVKDEKTTVGEFAKAHGVTPIRFVHWQLGRPE